MNSSLTVTKLAVALLKAQKEMGDVSKTARNPFFKSSYADLNSIREVVTPALNAQGISILQPTITLGEKNFVETILLHESGEFISGITEIKNVDGKPQTEGSGISYARRYGLQSMLNVGAVDDDGEAAQGRKKDENTIGAWEVGKYAGTKETKTTAVQVKPSTFFTDATSIKVGGATNNDIVTSGATKDLITSAFKVLEAQKQISKEAFKTNYLQGKGLSTVAPSELPNIYAKMKKDFPQLNSNGKGA